jgi:hypothetical protein
MRAAPVSGRREDEILRRAEKVDAALVRVEALYNTRPLLRLAGFLNPIPFRRYLVAVEEVGGRLRVKRPAARGARRS